MFKTSYKVLLALAFIIIVAYFLQNRANSPEACTKAEGMWIDVKEVCETPTKKVIFQSLSKPHPVSVLLPDTDALVLLDNAEQIDDSIYFRGQFEKLVTAANNKNQTYYERASVHLNMSKLALLSLEKEKITYFAAPFIINKAGSGIFTYVGLFSFDFTTGKAKHLSTVLLGNRIKEENITVKEMSVVKENIFVQEGVIRVDYKTHGSNQAFSEYPIESESQLLQLVGLDPASDKQATFRVLQTLHPSWDTDKDGINDCEKENSCDHSLDYSLPKLDTAENEQENK